MYKITNEQFNNAITEFNELLVSKLTTSDRSYELIIKNNYIKKLQYEKLCLFTSIVLSIKDTEYRIDFTVSFHDFYQVPILNFRVYNVDTFTTFDNIDLKVAPATVSLATVSLATHHLLQETWYEVHACETLETIEKLPEILGTSVVDLYVNYLCCWFGFYGIPSIFPQISFRPYLYK